MKLIALAHPRMVVKSPPARGRGLKPTLTLRVLTHYVAPRAGAWIETRLDFTTCHCGICRPPRGGVD